MNGIALTTVLVTVGSAEANRMVQGKPLNSSPVIGGFILGIFLFTFLMLNPSLATKFCYLIIVSALLINGGGLIQALTVQKPAAKPTTKTKVVYA
jgi:uncharacterized membrane protein YdcZ (DUF606 family)